MSPNVLRLLIISFIVSLSLCETLNKPPVWRNYLRKLLEEDGLYENLMIGSKLGTLDAYDPEGERIVYECISESVSCDQSGHVVLKRELDRELDIKNPGQSEQLLKTIFIASEVRNDKQEPSQNKKTLTIYVKDVNDNPPHFENLPYKVTVPETEKVGSTLYVNASVMDIDSGKNAEITLSCDRTDDQASIACDHFTIITTADPNAVEGAYFGNLVVKKELDYETTPSYIMTVLAKDHGSPTLSATVNILIDVEDKQDNPPVFLQSSYTMYVKENTAKGVSVGEVMAQDSDRGNPNPVKISLVNDPEGFFTIGQTVPTKLGNAYKAALLSNGNIDREKYAKLYRVNISATEISNDPLDKTSVTYSYINFEIQDDNDFPPAFEQSTYNMTFSEIIRFNDNSSLIGSPMIVRDEDLDINAIFSIRITSQSIPGVFGLSTNRGLKYAVVNLVVLKPQMLDYDIPAYRKQTIKITARQTNSTKDLSSSTTVYINLLDENDNAPVFEKDSYKASLSENSPIGTSIIKLVATDQDSGENKKIVYRLTGQGNEFFSVDINGVVTLLKNLDYEKTKAYNLLAIAENPGKIRQISSVEMEIQVLDYNDNGPIFQQKRYTSNITESTTLIQPPIKVIAIDKDSNSKMTYSIVGGNTNDNAFNIDKTSGIISARRPIMMEDADSSSTISLKVLATDNGAERKSSSTVVDIDIIDINNNKPIFKQSTYEKNLDEFTPGGTSILRVQATDNDRGMNAKISYFIKSGSYNNFQIDPRTGEVYVASQAQLDYDEYSNYTIQVAAEDQGTPRLTGSTTVIIKLNDINNKNPTFDKAEYISVVDENTTPGSTILQVHASDKDFNSNIEYYLLQMTLTVRDSQGRQLPTGILDYEDAFAIDRTTGNITLQTKLYHRLAATLSFQVRAVDLNSSPHQYTEARVVIITQASLKTQPFFLPENPGENKKIYEMGLPEDKQVGYIVTTVRAKDPINDQFVSDYFLAPGGQDQGFFKVTRNGEVILIKHLDYENKNYMNPLKFDIIARADSTRSAEAGMEITVKDINDNIPKFQKNAYYFQVSESPPYPFTIGRVSATDVDAGNFGQISYYLEGLNYKDFGITEDGSIYVVEALDYESRPIYNLRVVARDNPNGQVYQMAAVKLIIKVIDANDNSPVFQPKSEYTFSIQENIVGGEIVGQVSATDKDSNLNGEITYSLEKDGGGNFVIDQNTGEIKVARSGITPANSFSLRVKASDKGFPVLFDLAEVTVNVVFLIRREPRINQPQPGQNVSVMENMPLGTFVFKVEARARLNHSVIYTIEAGNTFTINNSTGIITTLVPLDRETQSSYPVIIVASEESNPTYASRRLLRVLVEDADDNRPGFVSCPWVTGKKQVTISEDSGNGSYVTQVSGCDADLFPYNKIAYIWADYTNCNNTDIGAFALDAWTGVIKTNIDLNYENISRYTLCVRVIPLSELVSENIYPMLGSDMQEITVNVQDINDNPPKFAEKEMFTVIYEKSPTGTEAAQVTAEDPDSFLYNKVKYSIEKIQCILPNSNTLYSTENAFIISRTDGRILTNLPNYIKFVHSTFIITVRAEDVQNPAFYSTKTVRIFVIQPRQQISVLFPDNIDVSDLKSEKLISDLNSLGLGSFVRKDLSPYRRVNQNEEKQTAMCFVVERNNTILSLSETQKLLELPTAQEILANYSSTSVGASCKTETTQHRTWSLIWWVLIAFAIFIIICSLILIVDTFLLYNSYKRFLESENISLLN